MCDLPDALEGLGERRHREGAVFVIVARERIEAIARGNLRAMPGHVSGTPSTWA